MKGIEVLGGAHRPGERLRDGSLRSVRPIDEVNQASSGRLRRRYVDGGRRAAGPRPERLLRELLCAVERNVTGKDDRGAARFPRRSVSLDEIISRDGVDRRRQSRDRAAVGMCGAEDEHRTNAADERVCVFGLL